ncbi:hypothetical protein [Kitasatospora sp. GAS1066B]|uniref:hypothetical protein n=1 Tax=Kitasatospora sp. GAS1066B TaxID=3156271 RepID=UPI003517B289
MTVPPNPSAETDRNQLLLQGMERIARATEEYSIARGNSARSIHLSFAGARVVIGGIAGATSLLVPPAAVAVAPVAGAVNFGLGVASKKIVDTEFDQAADNFTKNTNLIVRDIDQLRFSAVLAENATKIQLLAVKYGQDPTADPEHATAVGEPVNFIARRILEDPEKHGIDFDITLSTVVGYWREGTKKIPEISEKEQLKAIGFATAGTAASNIPYGGNVAGSLVSAAEGMYTIRGRENSLSESLQAVENGIRSATKFVQETLPAVYARNTEAAEIVSQYERMNHREPTNLMLSRSYSRFASKPSPATDSEIDAKLDANVDTPPPVPPRSGDLTRSLTRQTKSAVDQTTSKIRALGQTAATKASEAVSDEGTIGTVAATATSVGGSLASSVASNIPIANLALAAFTVAQVGPNIVAAVHDARAEHTKNAEFKYDTEKNVGLTTQGFDDIQKHIAKPALQDISGLRGSLEEGLRKLAEEKAGYTPPEAEPPGSRSPTPPAFPRTGSGQDNPPGHRQDPPPPPPRSSPPTPKP